MMSEFDSISDLVIPHEVLEFGGKRFKLLGLGLAEIIYIARNHGEALEPLYHSAASGSLPADATAVAMEMADSFGPVAATVIACGMRNIAARGIIAALPGPQQIEALDKIIRLTLVAEGGLEKTLEIVVRALTSAASMTKRPKT